MAFGFGVPWWLTLVSDLPMTTTDNTNTIKAL
jgi:hypothetical protein